MKAYYDHGGIQIFLGDCREILPEMKFDAVLSDPPYGMNLVPQRGITEAIIGDGQIEARRLWGWMVPQVDEFWEQVKTKQQNRDLAAMRKELIQIAAMAIRAVKDCKLRDAK